MSYTIIITTESEKHGITITYEWEVNFNNDGSYRQTDMYAYNKNKETIDSNFSLSMTDVPDEVINEVVESLETALDGVRN